MNENENEIEIETECFKNCKKLTQITISSSVTSIGNSAFSECSSLTQIIVPSSLDVRNIVIRPATGLYLK